VFRQDTGLRKKVVESFQMMLLGLPEHARALHRALQDVYRTHAEGIGTIPAGRRLKRRTEEVEADPLLEQRRLLGCLPQPSFVDVAETVVVKQIIRRGGAAD
jgi:hypothetical protein